MYQIKSDEIEKLYSTHLLSRSPIKLKQFPSREKKKYIILCMLVHLFEPNRIYKEKEINNILLEVHDDYAVLRRYLVDYKFLRRETDGSAYALLVDPKDYLIFKIIE